MSNSFFISFKNLGKLFSVLILFVLLICFLFIPTINASHLSSNSINESYSFSISTDEYIWPIPGYTSITSYFGKRFSPTSGASSYHKGIDIGAPQGTRSVSYTHLTLPTR